MKAGESIYSSAFILLPFSEHGSLNLRVVPPKTGPSTSLTVSDLLALSENADKRNIEKEQTSAPESSQRHF